MKALFAPSFLEWTGLVSVDVAAAPPREGFLSLSAGEQGCELLLESPSSPGYHDGFCNSS
jgi:hypothetical protein